MVTDEGATEVEADDGGEEVGVEWGDDDAGELDPLGLHGVAEEETEEGADGFWVADGDGDFGVEGGDEFREDDDEEDGDDGDDTAGPLEAGIFVGTGLVDEGGFDLEGLEVDHVLEAFGVEGGAPDAHESAED